MSKQIEIVKVRKSGDNVEYHTTTIDSYFYLNGSGETGGAVKGERALTHSFLVDSFRKLMGKTLTVIDASIMDEKQNKAIKDLVKNIFSDELEFAVQFAFDQEVLTKIADDSFNALSEEEKKEVLNNSVDIEEVLNM